jgi:hypothetical protein
MRDIKDIVCVIGTPANFSKRYNLCQISAGTIAAVDMA